MPRSEFKYYIPLQYLDDIRRDIIPYLNHDIYAKSMLQKEYTVRSIYMDSHQLFTYHEKLSGTKQRRKFRIRGYNRQSDDSIVFLEIKRKDVEHVSKDRVPLLYNDLDTFIKTKDYSLIRNFSEDTLRKKTSAQNFLYYYCLYNLQPTIAVVYEREAYECKFGSGLRITFDKNVRTRIAHSYSDLYQDEKMTPSFNNYFVLEMKFYKMLPVWLPSVMKKYNIIRNSVPKYALSIDATYNNNLSKYLY